MLRANKPRNARSKRAFEKREPKIQENPKTAIFVKGQHSSEKINLAMTELAALKKPHCIPFNKKNEVLPFEDTSSIEFWSTKNDAGLFLVGNHQKKRKDNLTWIRMFDGQVLDILEMGITAAKSIKEFKCESKPDLGTRPLFHFSGPQFTDNETDIANYPAHQHLKSLLLDFYRGEDMSGAGKPGQLGGQIALRGGIQHIISVTAAPSDNSKPNSTTNQPQSLADLYAANSLQTSSSSSIDTSAIGNTIHFRVYSIIIPETSATKTPAISLQECGPSFDFVLRRRRPANEHMLSQALKRPKLATEQNTQGKGKRKNVDTDDMGDMVGRVHMQKQDLGRLQTRKMKGLKNKHAKKETDSSDDSNDAIEDDDESE